MIIRKKVQIIFSYLKQLRKFVFRRVFCYNDIYLYIIDFWFQIFYAK